MLLHHFSAIPFEGYGITVPVHPELKILHRFLVVFLHKQRLAYANIGDIIVGIQLQDLPPYGNRLYILTVVMIADRFIYNAAEPGRLEDHDIALPPVQHQLVTAGVLNGCRCFERPGLVALAAIHIEKVAFIVIGEHLP